MIIKAICINNSYTTIIPGKSLRQMVWNTTLSKQLTRRMPCNHPHLVVGEWYQFDVKSGDQHYLKDNDEYHMMVPGGITVACGYIFSDKIKDEKYQFSKFFVTAKEWRESKLEQLID